ncbi:MULTISPECIES: energy transducer TonB [unclassified Acinetobacter]|uniref:energy transducer TonB family protein n=1 Tax=unclassified Acinetobacter TaxID=196816 RepID=UPI0025777273|nr:MULTISPECIES: energy transducer TonB [unclassified Acinetobacter]
MSQSSTSNMQAPNPMKKKVIAAVIAVLVGHMGALWALSHLKTPELKPIEKKPIQVKFVKIKEEQVIPPPPPPVKPKVEPKPVVEKKAPPPPVEKPKLITQKKPVVEKKAIQQEEPKIDQEKIKREQEQRQQEQQRQEQQRLEQQRQEQQRQEQQRQDQLRQQQEQQRQEQLRQQQEQQRRQQEAQQPRKLSAGEISWKKAPAFDFDDDLLKNQSRSLLVRIEINPAGKITNVTVLKSSGLPSLDREVRSAVRFARMNPSSDGRAMIANLPVSLKTSGQ